MIAASSRHDLANQEEAVGKRLPEEEEEEEVNTIGYKNKKPTAIIL